MRGRLQGDSFSISTPQCGLCETCQGRAERELFPFSPRESLFNLKIIECGKCWRWKLFISFPSPFLPLASPHSGSAIDSPRVLAEAFVLWPLYEVGDPVTARPLGPRGSWVKHSHLLSGKWHSANKSHFLEALLSQGSSPGAARMLRPPYTLPPPYSCPWSSFLLSSSVPGRLLPIHPSFR